jgi:hypothetical protein
MMPTFRKKPVLIEAFRLGERGQPTPAPEWFGSPRPEQITDDGILIQTKEGVMLARWGVWVIRGVHGEIYPCDPEIFAKTYDLVSEGR